ncbi:dynein axonemal assembly factor 6 isoform X2 [Rhinoraja longicauda]
MDFTFSVNQLQSLSNLLTHPEQEEEELEERPDEGAIALQPGHIGPKRSNPTDPSIVEPKDVKTIWSEDDVSEGSEYEDIWDTRQQPEYDVLFKQRVGTEDLFLGMSRKDGSTACCEDMMIRIKVPGCKPAGLTLDVKERFLGLRSSVYKLGLHLPYPVDCKNGKADFHADTQTLEVTLTMRRDYDFINFA